jgi:hypothetical protein
MCEPTTIAAIAMLAISATSAVVSHQTQEDAANQQEQAVQDGLAKDRAATARQYQQIQESAMDEQAQLHTDYLIDSARIRAIAGESGLGGLSQERIAQESANNAASDMATLEQNRARQSEQAHTSGLAGATKGGIQLAGIQRPSKLGTGLQIAGAAAKAYSPGKSPDSAQTGLTSEQSAEFSAWHKQTGGYKW